MRALLADNLARAGVDARSVELDLRPEGRVDANSLAFARAFDDPAFRGEIARALEPARGRARRVPGGARSRARAWRELQDRLGRPVFEVPTLPPSVPGMRVAKALRDRLRRAGGRVLLNNVVVGAERSGDRVTSLRVRVGLREVAQPADWVVLATGGFASGGLELDSRWQAREVALGLPVRASRPASGSRRRYFDDHPMGRAGVAVGPRPARPRGWRTCSSSARRWRARSRGRRSPATASASPPATVRRS